MKKFFVKILAVILVCMFAISGFNFSILADNTVQTNEKLTAINIGISGKISLMFYFTNIDEISGFRVTVGSGEASFVDKSELKYDSAKVRYLLTVKLAAAQQTDLVTLQAIDKNGNASSTVRQYSIRDYANKLLNLASSNSAYAVAAETVKFMLNYGAMAQKHFNYNAGNLANEGLYYRGTNPVDDMSYEDMYGIAAPSSYPLKENASQKPIWDVIHFTHVNAYLEDTVSLRFYFEYNGTKELEVWIGYIDSKGNTVDSTKYENEILQDENGDYYVLINNIPSICFNKQYSVLISEGTDNYAVMNYSVLNYVQAALASTDSETLRNVAYSMFQFYVCSSAYVGTPAPGFADMSSSCSHERTYTDTHLGNAVLCSDCAHNKGASGYFNLEGNTITANRGTKNEFAYQATGYTEAYAETGLYVPADQKLVITGDKIKSSTLTNRFHLQYYASVPVKLTMTYSHGNTTTDEIYYMEAGENTFSAVDYSFLASWGGDYPKHNAEYDKVAYYKNSSNFTLSKITVEPVESGKDMNFVLFHYYAETVTPSLTGVTYGKKTCYLSYVQDAHYKLGINLTWGGAISELYDLTASSGSINSGTNLINASDTGRLIQQSYYGTNGETDAKYTPRWWRSDEKLQFALWRYNPVQGGDANNEKSRIIDFEIDPNGKYIYIKAQPRDWANHSQINPANTNLYDASNFKGEDSRFTFCYIENRYTLKGDYIQVDNRMVDFSGYTHPYTTQELPAFYTLAYFDDYYWYNGSDPWNLTNGTANLTREDKLPFWGDPAKFIDTTFNYQLSNTETWGAFVNESTKYGIGMYVPNIDTIKGGRLDESEKMSASATDGETSYFAPLKTLQIVCYEPIEYSYLLCAGFLSDIRSTFYSNRNFASNYSLNENSISQKIPDEINLEYIDFSNETNALFVRDITNTISSFDASVGAVRLDVTAGDPYFYLNYALYDTVYTADKYGYIEFEYMIPAGNAGRVYQAQLFYCVGSVTSVKDATYSYFPINLTADGQFHTARINTSDLGAAWTGKINLLRIDFLHEAGPGDEFYIKSVKLGKANSYILNSGFNPSTLAGQIADGYGENHTSGASPFSATVNTNYVTVTKSHANGAYFTVRTNYGAAAGDDIETNNETGQYLVMKYRTNSASLKNFNIFASTDKYAAENGDACFTYSHLISDGEWHITYIDLSQMSSVVPSADGKYYLKYFRLDMTEAMAVGESIDIAYVGLCNADALQMLSADSSFGYLESNHRYHFQIDSLTNGTTNYVTRGFVNSTTTLSIPVASTNDQWKITMPSGWIALDNPSALAGLYYTVIDAKGNYSAWMIPDGILFEDEESLKDHVGTSPTDGMNTYTAPTVKRIKECSFNLGNSGGQVTVVVAAAFWDDAVSGGVSIQHLWEFDVDLPTFTPQSIVTNATTAGQGHLIGAENLGEAKITDGYLTLTKAAHITNNTYFSLLINSASDTAKIATGKYLAIKYRGNTTGNAYSQTYTIYASTNIYAAQNGAQALYDNTLIVDGEWHIAYFDLSRISDVAKAADGKYYINFVRFDFLSALPVGDSIDIAYIDLFDMTVAWHTAVDQFYHCTKSDLSDPVPYTNYSANSTVGHFITNGTDTLTKIDSANYIWLAGGWIAVNGYNISGLTCRIYDSNGVLRKTLDCGIIDASAETGIINDITGQGYSDDTVPYRINGDQSYIFNLSEYTGQTVTVVYSVDIVGKFDHTLDLIKIDVVVP